MSGKILLGTALLFLITAIGFYSCKSVYPVYTARDSYASSDLIDRINANFPEINTYSVRRLNLMINEDGDELNIRGSVRIKRDSVVLITLNAFAGFEVARVLMTHDSLKILDRINNQYFTGKYDESNSYLPVNVSFEIIQTLFLGLGSLPQDHDLWQEMDGNTYYFKDKYLDIIFNFPDREDQFYSQTELRILIDKNFLARNIELLNKGRDEYAKLNINSYQNNDGVYLPDNIELYYISGNRPLYANLRFGRIEINNRLNFNFSVPERYTRVN